MSTDSRPCPVCGRRLYAWIALPAAGEEASVGEPLEGRERVVDRCENCGVAAERGVEVDPAAEWGAVATAADGAERIAIPNRASLQAAIGVEGWAAIDASPGVLIHTPTSLELLAERNGRRLVRARAPFSRRAHLWMWQTLLNGLTFNRNFAREWRAGRLHPIGTAARLRHAVDIVVTVLGAPLVALVSVPLELGAGLAGRGGELVATAGADR